MGTSAPPDHGYKDDQRLQNWDSPNLYNDAALAPGGGIVAGPFDVGRYGYLAGYDQSSPGDLLTKILWYDDQAATHQVGHREFQLSSVIQQPAQYRLPNLGPFVTLNWTDISGGGTLHSSRIFATNRFHPLEFIPVKSLLIDQQNVNLAGVTNANVFPFDYYAGPVDVWFFAPAASWDIILQTLSTADIWENGGQAAASAAAGWQQSKYVTPPGAWRFLVQNQSAAAGNYFLIVRPSMTGST